MAYPSYAGFEAILYILKHVNSPKNSLKWFVSALGVTTVLYTLLMLVTIMVFNVGQVQGMHFPTAQLASAIEFQSGLFSRVDVIFITLWIIAIFTTDVMYYYMSVRNTNVFFNTKDNNQKYVLYSLLIIKFIAASIPKSIYEVFNWMNISGYIGISITVTIIPMMLVITLLKKRKKQKEQQ